MSKINFDNIENEVLYLECENYDYKKIIVLLENNGGVQLLISSSRCFFGVNAVIQVLFFRFKEKTPLYEFYLYRNQYSPDWQKIIEFSTKRQTTIIIKNKGTSKQKEIINFPIQINEFNNPMDQHPYIGFYDNQVLMDLKPYGCKSF